MNLYDFYIEHNFGFPPIDGTYSKLRNYSVDLKTLKVSTEHGETTFIRFFRRNIFKDDEISEKQWSEISMKVENTIKELQGAEILESGELSEIYDITHSGFGSCMEQQGYKFEQLDLRKEASIAYILDKHGYLVARSILWTIDEKTYYDTVYAHSSYFDVMINGLRKKGYKPVSSYQLQIPAFDLTEYLPYLDHFNMYYYEEGIVTNYHKHDDYMCIQDEEYDPEDYVWSKARQRYCFESNAYYINGDWYPEEDTICVQVGRWDFEDILIEDAEKNGGYGYHNGNYILKKDMVYCPISEQNVPEWETFVCKYDGERYKLGHASAKYANVCVKNVEKYEQKEKITVEKA